MTAKVGYGAHKNLGDEQWAALSDELLRARAHRLHEVPTWLKERLKAAGMAELPAGGWIDHPGSLTASDGTEVFLCEPYDLTGEKVRAALAFADAMNASLLVSPVSSWYPGSTVRLEFWPNEVGRLDAPEPQGA